MRTPKLSPIQREAAAILEADMRVSLAGEVITPARLREALIESVRTLSAPVDFTLPIHVERDPADANRLNISGPGVEFLLRFGPQP
jgi:hypothetical protein